MTKYSTLHVCFLSRLKNAMLSWCRRWGKVVIKPHRIKAVYHPGCRREAFTGTEHHACFLMGLFACFSLSGRVEESRLSLSLCVEGLKETLNLNESWRRRKSLRKRFRDGNQSSLQTSETQTYSLCTHKHAIKAIQLFTQPRFMGNMCPGLQFWEPENMCWGYIRLQLCFFVIPLEAAI